MLRYTRSEHHVPSPRDATSVAIRIGDRPALNSPSTQSRSRLVIDQLKYKKRDDRHTALYRHE